MLRRPKNPDTPDLHNEFRMLTVQDVPRARVKLRMKISKIFEELCNILCCEGQAETVGVILFAE